MPIKQENKMARNKNKTNHKQQDRHAMLMVYAQAVNLYSIDTYQQWCIEYGFSTNVNKSKLQLKGEYLQYKRLSAISKLKKYKREENMHQLIQNIYANDVRHKDLNSDALKLISHGFKITQNKKLLRDVLLFLEENSKLLTYSDYIKGVISFVAHYGLWLQPIFNWQAKTHNVDRQFSSLARYLFAQYDVPAFMDSVWYKGEAKARGWFIHLGQGKNIRTASSLPIRMTKKMAHFFNQAPARYELNAAFRWAQIHALGGNHMIADSVAQTRLAREFKDDTFCLTVLRFFIDNPMLDISQYNPIIDYIWNQKYENRMLFVERGIAREEGPEQPNFSMRGRTPATLLNHVDSWHRRLGRESRGGNLQWIKSKFANFSYVEGRENRFNMKIWTINELLSSNELVTEGRKQHHCVASYARTCSTGNTSIWTMDVQAHHQLDKHLYRHKLLTIELHNSSKTIRQIRGLKNRLATKNEIDIINRWSQKEGLSIANYI